jgi:signal transduction histidine kinase
MAPPVLGVLLALLAVLQYRWTGELGRAEEERARGSLNRAAAGFAADFDRELGRLFFHFLPPAEDEPRAELARRVATWREQPVFPDLLRQALLARRRSDGGWGLAALDERTGAWRAIAWPPELAPLRRQLGEHAPPLAAAEPPALVAPLWRRGAMERRMPPPGLAERRSEGRFEGKLDGVFVGEGPAELAILWLDVGALRDRLLPALVERHFGGDVDYHIEVRDATGRPLFTHGPAVAASQPDLAVPLFRVPLAERFAHHHGMRHQGGAMRMPGPPAGDDDPFRGHWLLTVTHPAGSLATAVARARWRNFAVSLLILALLALAVALVLAAARRAEALARRQIELVAGVSHELLTPVAAVRSAGENLAAGVVADPAQVRAYGELIVREGRRLGSLVEQVLTWAGLQARAEPAARGPVDPATLVEAVTAACAGEAQRAGVRIETRVAPQLPAMRGDRDALERALRNLVENALRHGGSGAWVGVGADPGNGAAEGPPSGITLWVEDRGPGLAAEDLPHLFEPFYRGRGGVAGGVPGSGLGLALARQIAEAHGGRVSAASAAPAGARFTLELPGVADVA